MWTDFIAISFSGYVGFGGGSSMPGLFRSLCNRINSQELLTEVKKKFVF